MKIIKTIKEFNNYRKNLEGKIGFVPTMGYLHEGHLSLMKKAKKECDIVIVSIFVNPTQFSPNEDLEKYPRDFEGDKDRCRSVKVDAIFYPEEKEMYPEEGMTTVIVEKITKKLCGVSRPTHFQGVTTVVSKLFNIVKPNRAYFGQKDLQQSIVIKRMVKDLNIDVNIVVCPILREDDGLAMSSRNEYLNEKERTVAPIIYESLQLAKNMFDNGEKSVERLKLAILEKINSKISDDMGKIDYVEIFDTENINNVMKVNKGNAIALAVYLGKARLIDNIIL